MKPRITSAPTVLILVFGLLMLAAGGIQAKKVPPARPVDLNSATAAQLEEVPGIGPSTAQAIIAFRTKSSPFHRVEDLLAVHGISKRKLDQMRPYVMVVPAKLATP